MDCVGALGIPSDRGGEAVMTFQPLISPVALVVFLVVGLSLVTWTFVRGRRPAPGGQGIRTFLRRGGMVLLLGLAFAGPAIPVEQEDVVSNVEIVFAVDRTGSMAAEDGPDGAPRLDAVRRDIRTLVEASSSARFAVVTWDSSTRVELPVTTDSSAVVNFADNLHQEVSEFSTGSSLERPARVIRDLLEGAAQERPQNLRYLVVFSDGEATDGLSPAGASEDNAWAGVYDLIDGGAVLGYGTGEGGPMRIYGVGGAGSTEEYMTDDGGEIATSAVDEDSLQELASELGMPFLLNPSEAQLQTLGSEFIADANTVIEGRPTVFTYSYLTWIPALGLAVLVGWEIVVFTMAAVRLRRTHAL